MIDGQFSSPQHVSSLRAPLLVRLLLVLLSQYLPSRITAPIRDGWYRGWRRCSKVPVSSSFLGSLLDSPFSLSDSPLVGLRPFLLPLFHPELRSVALFSLWFFVVSCGTGWASTSIDNIMTTVSPSYTYTELQLSLHFHMLEANFHQVQPAEHTRRK